MKKNILKFKRTVVLLSVFAVYAGSTNLFAQEPMAPETVVSEYCTECHDGGFKAWITGAPKIGELEEWQEYFDTGLETMSKNVYTGEKKHEIKGNCEACTQDDITAAVQYIMDKTN